MSFSKRSNAAPICRSKPLDSVKNYNDHFFWVDAIAFPLSVPLHKRKTLKKDPFPKSSQYNAKVCDFLRTHTALFWKFPEPFLYWVGISRYYELDENSYPSFLADNNEAMDLFSVIHHAGPTKVRVGKIEKVGDQVSLLEATHGRVVLLVPPILVTAASSEGNMTESIEMLFDEGNGAEKEHSTRGGKKRKATRDASGSTLPSKKLRDDYGTSGASASTGGKSRVVMQDLLDNSKLAVEIEVADATTVPLITSSMTLTPEHEKGDHINSIFGPNLRTKPATMWFVISSDSSHHFGTHAMDVEVSSLIRSIVSDPLVMTTTVTTTAAVETSLVSVPKVTVKPVNPALFRDFMSTSRHGVAGLSSSVHPELSANSFYAIQDLNPETHAPGICSQTCLDAKVWMRAEHTLRKKKILEEKCAQQTDLLKEKDVEIAILKSKLSLKETEAVEAIRLRGHVATVEAAEALHAAELNLLKERKSTLEAKIRASETKATALEYEKAALLIRCLRWRLLVPNFATKSLHGKAGRALSDVAAHNPSADADYVAAVSALSDVDFSLLTLLASQKDASIADIMDSLRLEGHATEISGAGELQPSHEQLMLPIHRPEDNVGDAEARRLSLSDAMVPLIEPLSSENLLGEASTFGVPVTIDAVTTLSTTFAQSVSVSVPLLSVADHGVVHTGPQDKDPSSGRIVFKKEELETSPEPAVGS
ncbi:hypothetical protein Tco_0655777 [Tanacetum coccineum]|uniref:Transposase (Putative), gypsy type n=1 Tax=Tanacetum coccineum TaxID=301880 RepID=A0ABQ4X7E2_9ASTR